MSGVIRKTEGPSGIILQDPDAITRTIDEGLRRMERSPAFQRATTLHPRHSVVPSPIHHSDLGRRARIFGTPHDALHGHRPQHSHVTATHGRQPTLRQPSVALSYERSPTGIPRMIPVFGSRQEVQQALRRGEITSNSVIRLQRNPHEYYDCRVYQLGLYRGAHERSAH